MIYTIKKKIGLPHQKYYITLSFTGCGWCAGRLSRSVIRHKSIPRCFRCYL